MCEMMNMPGHGENGFTAEQINYQVTPVAGDSSIRAAWITLDPAFGEQAHNDNSAIVVHVLPEEGPPMVVEYVHAQMSEVELFEQMLRLAYRWNAWVWGIEAIAAQKVLITLFQLLLVGKMMQGRVEFIPLIAGKGDPKVARISSWVSLMAKGEYAIPEYDVEITNQLLSYNMKRKSNKDDLIDSCAYGPMMLLQYEALLVEQFNGQGAGQSSPAHFGMEVVSV